MSKVFVFIAMSVDGFIAGKNGDISFLDKYNTDTEDYGYNKIMENVGTVIIGYNSYQKVLSFGVWPYDKKIYVLTSKTNLENDPNVEFFYGDLNDLISKIKSNNDKDIFVDGGGKVVQSFYKKDLIDEITINLVPEILGSGMELFGSMDINKNLSTISVKQFTNGLVQLRYSIKS